MNPCQSSSVVHHAPLCLKIGCPYPARLLAADTRPIENKNRSIALVRLEFEIFKLFQREHELRSTGQIACRDLVLWPGAADDFGVVPFAIALGVRDLCKPTAWSALANRDLWVEIVFGPVDERDGRNRFAEISRFAPDEYEIANCPDEQSKHWVTTGEAARKLRRSQSTIIRRVNEFEAERGALLVRYTGGEAGPSGRGKHHRRINLLLLRNLLDDPAWL